MLRGTNLLALRYEADDGSTAQVAVAPVEGGGVLINGFLFKPEVLRFLADLAKGDHTMFDCHWVDCPEHACPFTFSHTQETCGRPTCRRS